MITLERTKVMGVDAAIRGMRNPMQSWEWSDSYEDKKLGFVIGENDMRLARRLIHAGSDERKFLRQIFVSVDVTAPLYWWKEYDTYKVGTVANSTSTMHKIHAKEFILDDFSHERLHSRAMRILNETIDELNMWRNIYNNGGWVDNFDEHDTSDKFEAKDMRAWHNMIQLLPSSYNQMRTCTLNYENLINIYFARNHHKLPEWHTYCEWIMKLPYASEFFSAADKATKL